MAFSRTAPRHEISYLRRRPKVGEKPPASRPAGAGAPALSLKRPGAEAKIPAAKVRRAEGRAILTPDAPTVTLNRFQSAVGALALEVIAGGGGGLSCAWELVDGEAGLVSAADDVRVSPQFGRRPIVQLHKDRIVVGLRHGRELRRLLLLASGLDDAKPSRIVGELYGGATVESAHTGLAPVVVALAIYQVDGELVIRREDSGFDSPEAAAAAYGFSLTWLPPVER